MDQLAQSSRQDLFTFTAVWQIPNPPNPDPHEHTHSSSNDCLIDTQTLTHTHSHTKINTKRSIWTPCSQQPAALKNLSHTSADWWAIFHPSTLISLPLSMSLNIRLKAAKSERERRLRQSQETEREREYKLSEARNERRQREEKRQDGWRLIEETNGVWQTEVSLNLTSRCDSVLGNSPFFFFFTGTLPRTLCDRTKQKSSYGLSPLSLLLSVLNRYVPIRSVNASSSYTFCCSFNKISEIFSSWIFLTSTALKKQFLQCIAGLLVIK